MKRMIFIYNPRSGKGLIKNALFDIINIFAQGGFEVTAFPTFAPDDAYNKIISSALDYDIVSVSGGDGTLSQAVNALMQLPTKVPLGYIPSGSTNDFASSMSISKKMTEAAQDIVDGVFYEYDVGRFNSEKYFVYVAGFGMFTDISYETPQDIKNIFGHAAYIAEALKRLSQGVYRGIDITVEHDGNSETGNFLIGLVSNSASIAGMKFLVSDSVYFDDGLFEVTLVRTPSSPLELQQVLNDTIINRLNTKHFLTFKTKKVTFKSDEPIAWTLDGESGGAYALTTVENCRRAIKLVIKPDEKTDQQRLIDHIMGINEFDEKNMENRFAENVETVPDITKDSADGEVKE